MRLSEDQLAELLPNQEDSPPLLRPSTNTAAGDNILVNPGKLLRLVSININSIGCRNLQLRTEMLCHNAMQAHADFLGVTEPNIDFTQLAA